MKKPEIVVHCLIKNEENFIWYAINSILPFVDKIMIWDNGSTDKTAEIIKTINSPKVEFESHPVSSREAVGHLRQEMLEKTPDKYDWLMILDGDEVWSEKSLKKVLDHITKHPKIETVVTKTYNLVGDIYHRLPNKFGRYTFLDKKGNYSMRFINLKIIPGLHVGCSYGSEGYYDGNNLPIQYRRGVVFVDTEYFHATHLPRSSQNKNVIDRSRKLKYYLGKTIYKEKIPSVFLKERPNIVPNVTNRMNTLVIMRSFIETILRNIKNIIVNENH